MAYISPYSYVSGINNEPLLKVDFESKQKVIDKKQEDFDDAYRNIATLSTPILFSNMYNEKAQQVAESYNTEFNSYFDINNNYDYSDPKLLNNIKNKLTQFTQDPILKNDFNFQKRKEDISKSIQESVKNKTYNPESAFIIDYEDGIYKKSSDPLSIKPLSEYVPAVDIAGQLKDLNCDDDWDISMGQEQILDRNPDGSYKKDANGNFIIIEEVLNNYTRKSKKKEKLKSCYETVIGNNLAYFNTKAKYNKIINQNNPLYQRDIVKSYQTFNNNEIARENENIQSQEKLLRDSSNLTIDEENNIKNYLSLAKDKIKYLQKNNETANFEDIHDYTFYNIQSENYAFGKAREQIVNNTVKNIQYEISQNEKYKNIKMSLIQAQIKETEANTKKIKAETSNIVSENNQNPDNQPLVPNSDISVSQEKKELNSSKIFDDLKSSVNSALLAIGNSKSENEAKSLYKQAKPIYDELKSIKPPLDLTEEELKDVNKVNNHNNELLEYKKKIDYLMVKLQNLDPNKNAEQLLSQINEYEKLIAAYDYHNDLIIDDHVKNIMSFIRNLTNDEKEKIIAVKIGNNQFKHFKLKDLTNDDIKDNYNGIVESFKNLYRPDYSKGYVGLGISKVRDIVDRIVLAKNASDIIVPSAIIELFVGAGKFIWNKAGEYNSRIPNLSNDIRILNDNIKNKSDKDRKVIIDNFNKEHPYFQFSDDYGSGTFKVTGAIGDIFEKIRNGELYNDKGKSFYELSLPTNKVTSIQQTSTERVFHKNNNKFNENIVEALNKIGFGENDVDGPIRFNVLDNTFTFLSKLDNQKLKEKTITDREGNTKSVKDYLKNNNQITIPLRDMDPNITSLVNSPIYKLFLFYGKLGNVNKPILLNHVDGGQTKAVVEPMESGTKWRIRLQDPTSSRWNTKTTSGAVDVYSADEIVSLIDNGILSFK